MAVPSKPWAVGDSGPMVERFCQRPWGLKENVLAGETGLVVAATEESLTRAVLETVADPLRLREMGRAARRYVESRVFADAFQASWEMYGTA